MAKPVQKFYNSKGGHFATLHDDHSVVKRSDMKTSGKGNANTFGSKRASDGAPPVQSTPGTGMVKGKAEGSSWNSESAMDAAVNKSTKDRAIKKAWKGGSDNEN